MTILRHHSHLRAAEVDGCVSSSLGWLTDRIRGAPCRRPDSALLPCGTIRAFSMATDQKRLASVLALGVHELRTPMTVAAGYLRMLLQGHGGDLTASQRTLAEHAERSVDRIGALVAELRNVATLESGAARFERHRIPLFRIVADAVQQIGDTRVQVQSPDAYGWIHGDAARLRAAFVSLVTAVLRSHDDREPLRVDCLVLSANRRRSARVWIGGAPVRAGRLRAFDEWRGGVGLTLPIARRVIEAHGGQVHTSIRRAHSAIVVDVPLTAAGRSSRKE